jgi:hypothetical protein
MLLTYGKIRGNVELQRHKRLDRPYVPAMAQQSWVKHAAGGNLFNYVAWPQRPPCVQYALHRRPHKTSNVLSLKNSKIRNYYKQSTLIGQYALLFYIIFSKVYLLPNMYLVCNKYGSNATHGKHRISRFKITLFWEWDRVIWLVGTEVSVRTYCLHILAACELRPRLLLQNNCNHASDYTVP